MKRSPEVEAYLACEYGDARVSDSKWGLISTEERVLLHNLCLVAFGRSHVETQAEWEQVLQVYRAQCDD